MKPLIATHSYKKDTEEIKTIINPNKKTNLKVGYYYFEEANETNCLELLQKNDIRCFNIDELKMIQDILLISKDNKIKEIGKTIHISISMLCTIKLNDSINITHEYRLQLNKIFNEIENKTKEYYEVGEFCG